MDYIVEINAERDSGPVTMLAPEVRRMPRRHSKTRPGMRATGNVLQAITSAMGSATVRHKDKGVGPQLISGGAPAWDQRAV